MKRKTLIVNADDIGLHPAVDNAVAELAERALITSASVMSLGAADRDALGAMIGLGMDLGLHLDFTSVFACRRYGTDCTVNSLIGQTWLRRLSPEQTHHIVNEQLDRFETLVGAVPVFVDGHEHVHQFPVIREALMQVLAERYPGRRMFLRNTAPRRWQGAKAAIIGMLGAGSLRRLAREKGHAWNADFAGVYDFHPESDLPVLWSGWLATCRSGGVIMCHPASAEVEGDAIAAARVREYRFLASRDFDALLRNTRTEITGWKAALAS